MTKEKQIILQHKSVSRMAEDLVSSVNDGLVNPLEAFVAIKHMEEVCKLANKQLKEQAIEEAETYGTESKDLNAYGAKIQVKNGAGRWNFSHIEEINELELKLKELKDNHKTAFKMRQKGNQMVTEDGELIQPAYYLDGAQVIAIKLKK
tara:strand:+ start:1006 stop:1452 length:447 start_codon:yes stop_codon:yes gene_type:complete